MVLVSPDSLKTRLSANVATKFTLTTTYPSRSLLAWLCQTWKMLYFTTMKTKNSLAKYYCNSHYTRYTVQTCSCRVYELDFLFKWHYAFYILATVCMLYGQIPFLVHVFSLTAMCIVCILSRLSSTRGHRTFKSQFMFTVQLKIALQGIIPKYWCT